MADYDSDSSGAEDVETGVTLGYASKEPTGDDFSQLGGHPTWFDEQSAPSGALAKCKVCNGLMNLLLQLNGDLPDRFAGHQRRLYVFGCRRKACRRKSGSVRGIRTTKIDHSAAQKASESKKDAPHAEDTTQKTQPSTNLGETLFGVKSPGATSQANPFSTPSSGASNPFSTTSSGASNPFAAASSLAAKPAQKPSSDVGLSETFAQKARISTEPTEKQPSVPAEKWPEQSAFPPAFPAYYIDADAEFLEPEPQVVPTNARLDDDAEQSGSGDTAVDTKTAFESSMDKAFQRFADRLSQNPEQVLRYDFAGQPLLYSKKDAVGKAWPGIPRCGKCGADRVFELQLTPHAITELEVEDLSLEGMDWGTIILAVCSADCDGDADEWIGVQWEELATK